MRPTRWIAIPTVCLAVFGCERAGETPLAPLTPDFHVGFPRGVSAPLGFVSNDAECHIGKRGNRWPAAEQWEVIVHDAQLVVTPGGNITLICSGDMPPTLPNGTPLAPPAQAEVEQDVLCFLPNGRQTRQAQELFTPSGRVVLTCHYNPTRDG
jgi:hypothetical protein